MPAFIQKHFRGIFLVLFALLGVSLGHFAATSLGIYLSPGTMGPKMLAEEQSAPLKKATLADYEIILQRNIFNSSDRKVRSFAEPEKPSAKVTKAPPARTDLKLLGTVSAGAGSLALIEANREIGIYRIGDETPGGGVLDEISRNQVSIRNRDGSVATLTLFEAESLATPSPAPVSAASGGGDDDQIKEIGENQWLIDSRMAENARNNIGELLKSARMEPNLVEGRTDGFIVKMIQPKSLLAKLGIQKGDVIMQVNGVELESPEKALQIFQQLREARHISIGLQRNGAPMNFDYEVD